MPRKPDDDFDPEEWYDEHGNDFDSEDIEDLTEDELDALMDYIEGDSLFPELDYLDDLDNLQDDEDFYEGGK